jgi:hypothetical protein
MFEFVILPYFRPEQKPLPGYVGADPAPTPVTTGVSEKCLAVLPA